MKRIRFGRVLLFIWLGVGLWFVMFDISAPTLAYTVHRYSIPPLAADLGVLLWLGVHWTLVWAAIFVLPERLRARSRRSAPGAESNGQGH